MNKAALKALLTSGNECGSDDSPDDMMLGVWLKRLGIPVLHSPLFHQVSGHVHINNLYVLRIGTCIHQ